MWAPLVLWYTRGAAFTLKLHSILSSSHPSPTHDVALSCSGKYPISARWTWSIGRSARQIGALECRGPGLRMDQGFFMQSGMYCTSWRCGQREDHSRAQPEAKGLHMASNPSAQRIFIAHIVFQTMQEWKRSRERECCGVLGMCGKM